MPTPHLRWTYVIFPLFLATVTLGSAALLNSAAPPFLIGISALLTILLVITLLERVLPLHAPWNTPPDRIDLMLLIVNRGVDALVLGGSLWLLARLDLGSASSSHLWPTTAPLAVQAVLGITLSEAFRYLMHRLSHRRGWLGRVHRTHHQPQRMIGFNGPRLHPGNYLWISVATIVPMLALGAPVRAVALAMIVTSFFVIFQHANVRLGFAPWNRFFATPDVHRMHHAKAFQGRPVNYGIVLLLFDQVFGTFRTAEEVEVDAIGSSGVKG